MPFRIRPSRTDDDPNIIQAKNERYISLLDQIDFEDVPNLFTYFARDFFHDGRMCDFRLSSDLRTFRFRVIANFPVLRAAESRDKVRHSAWAWFTCTFRGLVSFRAFGTPHTAAFQSPGSESVFFDCAEINTVDDEFRQYSELSETRFYSLSIETTPACRSLELIFAKVHVAPDEPLAFDLLQQSGMYDVRLATTPSRAS